MKLGRALAWTGGALATAAGAIIAGPVIAAGAAVVGSVAMIATAMIGIIPAFIAQSKGRSFILWWIYGTLIFIVALPHSIIMKSDKEGFRESDAL